MLLVQALADNKDPQYLDAPNDWFCDKTGMNPK